MNETASNIAKYIIGYFAANDQGINNVKLQKLLYYVQGWHLALHGKPLFWDRIEAWVHGPVVPSVFQEYKSFRWSPLKATGSYEPAPKVKAHIDEIMWAYADFSSWDLERLTHSEAPWQDARGSLPPDISSKIEISHEAMKAYFSRDL